MSALNSSSLHHLFTIALKEKASDIHLAVGQPPVLRIAGQLHDLDGEGEVTREKIFQIIKEILPDDRYAHYQAKHDIDVSFELETKERLRVNLYWSRGEPSLAARLIPNIIPTLDQLEAPEAVLDFLELNQGLVLVTGPTGSGKSTLLASMVESINQKRDRHILTLEDPIEFIYEPKLSLISQREYGLDFLDYADGLKHALRQDPDVIMVQELRDPETISTALTLAETGHVVFSTLHTNGAAQTIERIIDAFAGERQKQIRLQLSLSLKGIISQLLLPSVDQTELVPVHEVLVNTPAIGNMIREGRTEQIQNVILTSNESKMQDLDQALMALVDSRLITQETAMIYARNPKTLFRR